MTAPAKRGLLNREQLIRLAGGGAPGARTALAYLDRAEDAEQEARELRERWTQEDIDEAVNLGKWMASYFTAARERDEWQRRAEAAESEIVTLRKLTTELTNTASNFKRRAEELRRALAIIMGDADHGQGMTWTERCRIARASLHGERDG